MSVETIALALLMLISIKWVLIDGITNAPLPFAFFSIFVLNGILLAAGVYVSQPLRQNAVVRALWISILAFVIMGNWMPVMRYQFTLASAIWSLALMGWSRFVVPEKQRTGGGEVVALVLLMITSIKWMLVDGIAGGLLDPVGYDGKLGLLPPFANLFVLSGIVLAAGIYLSQVLRKQHPALQGWWITIMAFVALNVEAIRCVDYWPPKGVELWILKNAIISVLWGVLGLAGILVGFRRKLPPVRWVALTLLGITAAKVMLIDMSKVETALRVLSFLVLGVVLLVVSFVYHKVGALVAGTNESDRQP